MIALLMGGMTGCVPQDRYEEMSYRYYELQDLYKKEEQKSARLQSYIDSLYYKYLDPRTVLNDYTRNQDPLQNVSLEALAEALKKPGTPGSETAVPVDWQALAQNPELNLSRTGTKLYQLTDYMLFGTGEIVLSDKDKARLDIIARELRRWPRLLIYVEGHADADERMSRDTTQVSNRLWEISTQRAAGVARELETRGISGTQILAIGRGASAPIRTDPTEAVRRLNRRVVIKLFSI